MAVKINGDTVIDNSKNFTGVQFNVSGDIRVGPAPGDPAAYIRTQTIPAGDPNLADEATELILFHSNDPAPAHGPDYITLRAPGVRLQTYNNATIADPSNTAGSLNRLIIAPSGIIDVGVDIRSPYYYDTNNTAYYVKPSSTSILNTLGMAGLLYTKVTNTTFTSSNDTVFSVRGDASYSAVMSFHRSGAYAVNFGLDTDNVMKLGGWSASTIKHNWDMSGNYYCTGNITAYYSDERLKDFHGTIPNALEKISQLNGYYFTENQTAKDLGCSNDRMQVGLSAQEVERVFPEIVTNSAIENDQGYKTIWYDKMVPLLVEAIKEQQKIIDNQNSRLANLEEQLTQLLNKTII